MTLTKRDLEVMCFNFKINPDPQFKEDLLKLYGTDPDEYHVWSEQDIYEQVRKKLLNYNSH